PRVRTELRRVTSLTRALRRAPEQVVLLHGDPGAGKSVALRHLACELAREAKGSRRLDCPIPLYINLKGLRRPADEPVDAKLIEAYVNRELKANANLDIDRFIDAEFETGVREGTWIFLFDSFDEIPEILAEQDSGPAIRAYSSAVHDFLAGMRRCRGIVASRQFRSPQQTGWPVWTLLPLSSKRKRALVQRAQLSREHEQLVLAQLADAESAIGPLNANPMFLGLLCEYVRERSVAPPTVHAAFERYLDFRMRRDADRLAKRFELAPAALRVAAEWTAYAMVISRGTGLTPTRGEIEAELARLDAPLEVPLARALDALEYLKLARGERDDGGTAEEARFTFAHRRFQEYFATCLLLRDRDLISTRELLLNARWRETAVTMLQTQDAPADELLATATELLGTAADEVRSWQRTRQSAVGKRSRRSAFPWPNGSLHLFGLLQDGLAPDDPRLPTELVAASSEILEAAVADGYVYDRKWAVESCGMADAVATGRLILAALRTPNDWVRDAAAKQLARLSRVDAEIVRELRRMLLRMHGKRRLREDAATVRAQLARLPADANLARPFRLLRSVTVIDTGANIAVAAWYLLLVPINPPWAGVVILALLAMSLSSFHGVSLWLGNRPGLSVLELADTGIGPSSAREFARRGIPARSYEDSAEVLAMVRGVAVVLALAYASPAPADYLVAGILLPFALTWGPATLLNVESGRAARRRTWLIPQVTVLRSAARLASAFRGWWEVVGAIVMATSFLGVVALLGLLARLIRKGFAWLNQQTHDLIVQVAWLRYALDALLAAVLLPVLILLLVTLVRALKRTRSEVRETRHDAIWDERLSTQEPATLSPAELLEAIDAQQTPRGVARVMTRVRTRRLLAPSALAHDVLLDLLAVAEVGELDPAGWRTELTATWCQDGGAEQIVDMGEETGATFVDELGKLLEELALVRA
ncbi:MAG TPA: NACHT domain-containing protein, partial [Conexibacter sp.]|nr:NACHT domain-containing protein [Conexibacter sp.]